MEITGKKYIEFLESKNLNLDDIFFDVYEECGNVNESKIDCLNINKFYSSNNNNRVFIEIIFHCIDINSLNKQITYDELTINEEIQYKKEIDNMIDYDLFESVSINIYGDVLINDSLDDRYTYNNEYCRGIGLKNKKYFSSINPFYELNIKNLEQVLYIQESLDKTPHINFLLNNYLFYYNKIIEPIIIPTMETFKAICISNIELCVTNDEDSICDNEIRLDFIKKEENFYEDITLFSIYIDFLYGNLYGILKILDISKEPKYIPLNEITKEKLLNELLVENSIINKYIDNEKED
jgi:hypothetical protein